MNIGIAALAASGVFSGGTLPATADRSKGGDGRYVLPQGFSDPSSFFDQCRRGLDVLWDEGATHPRMMSIGLHSRWAGQAGRTSLPTDVIGFRSVAGGGALPRRRTGSW